MTYKKFNVARPREEQQKDGTTKTFWDNVGKITIFTKDDGSESGKLELFSFAARTLVLNVFEFRNQENKPKPQTQSQDEYSQPAGDEEIRVENIPF